jgi:hypothetical protein
MYTGKDLFPGGGAPEIYRAGNTKGGIITVSWFSDICTKRHLRERH